jgi:hypothetical protein
MYSTDIVEKCTRIWNSKYFTIPPELKIHKGLQHYDNQSKGPNDLIVVIVFPGDKNFIEESLRKSGAQIVETKIKPANTWFVRAPLLLLKNWQRFP